MTGGRTTSNTNLSSRRWRNRTTGSSWAELSAAMLDFSSASRLFSMIRMSPILTGNMCSSRACTKAKNLSRYWSWRMGGYQREKELSLLVKYRYTNITKSVQKELLYVPFHTTNPKTNIKSTVLLFTDEIWTEPQYSRLSHLIRKEATLGCDTLLSPPPPKKKWWQLHNTRL